MTPISKFDDLSKWHDSHTSPRFGLIPTVTTLRDMKAGEEVFCSYDYKLDSAPPWYQELNAIRICKLYKKVKMLWNKAV